MTIKLSLKKLFENIGRVITNGMKDAIRKQTDLDDSKYFPVTRKVKSGKRQGRTVKSYERKSPRLLNSGKFNQGAFEYKASDATLIFTRFFGQLVRVV
jgi:hypothetical protein